MRGENGLSCFHKVSPNLFHSFCHMTHVHFPQSPRPLRFPSIAPSPRHPSVIPLSALLRLWVAVRENMRYVRNGIVLILVLQYAVCTQYANLHLKYLDVLVHLPKCVQQSTLLVLMYSIIHKYVNATASSAHVLFHLSRIVKCARPRFITQPKILTLPQVCFIVGIFRYDMYNEQVCECRCF